MKWLKSKYVVIAAVLVIVFVVTSGSFKLTLVDRAIIVGLAIDEAENGEIELSAQIIVTIGSGESGTTSDTFSIVKGTGKTVIEGLSQILSKSAQFPSLAHCSAVIVSSSFAEKYDLKPIVEYLLRNTKIEENTVFVCSEGRADEVLSEEISISIVSAFAIEKIIAADKNFQKMSKGTLIEYYVSRYDDKPFYILPYVKLEEIVTEPGNSVGSEISSTKRILSMDSSACFGKDTMVLTLDKKETEMINFVKKKFSKGIFELYKDTAFELIEKKATAGCEMTEDGSFNAEVEIVIQLLSMKDNNSVKKENLTFEVTEEQIAQLEGGWEQRLSDVFEKCRAYGLDAFGFYDSLSKKEGDKMKEHPDYLDKITLKTTVKVSLV